MDLDKLHKIIRVILIAIPVVFLGWLLSKDLVVSGKLEATYDFKSASPFIMPLAPKARVSEIKTENGVYYQSMFDDPIYFDVRLPRPFQKITLWIKYRPDAGQAVRLAVFSDKDQWKFEVKDFSEVQDLPDGWKLGRAEFDLSGKKFAWQKYQMMISLPGIRGSGREVDVSEIRVLAEREALTLSNFWSRLKSKLSH